MLGVREAGRALRDFATYLPSQAIPAIAGFLVLPLLARRLSPTDLGILAIAQTLVTFGWTMSGSWLTQAIIRELPLHRANSNLAGFARTLRGALAVTASLLLLFAGALSLASLGSDAIRANLVLIIAATAGLVIQNIAVSLFAASLRPLAFGVVDVIARIGGITVGTTLVFLGYGVRGYLTGLAVASLVVGAMGLWRSWPHEQRDSADQPRLSGWLRYGIPSSTAGIVLWGLFFIDRYLLAALKNTGAVGIYSVGSVIGDRAVALPTMAFFTAAAPLLVSAYEQHGRQEVERLMRSYTRVILLTGIPVIAFLGTSAGILVPLFAGTQYYREAGNVAPFVGLGSLVYVLALVSNTGLVISKRTLPLAYSAAVGLTANVVANLILIPPMGILGAAISTPIGMAGYLLTVHAWAHPHATWRFPFTTLARACAAAAAAWGAAALAMPVTAYGALQLVIAVVVGGAVYVGTLSLLGEHRAELVPG
ncbi:MAG TPA: oligosaccharide flippase family protein [Gaiellaceae bacterium]|jgi:O-antigen/teichoic acid export membrane protein